MLTFKQRSTFIEIKSATQAGTPGTALGLGFFPSKSVYPLCFLPKTMHVPDSADNLQNHREAACASCLDGLPRTKPPRAKELPFSPPFTPLRV